MKLIVLIVGIGIYGIFVGTPLSYAKQASSDVVEIIVDGKRYGSMHEYRLKQIENILMNALATDDLQVFTEEELYKVIKRVRDQQASDTLSMGSGESSDLQPDAQQQNSGKNTLDADSSQMQKMLKSYYKEHKEVSPVLFDPQKVKSIIIEPKKGI